MQKHKSSTLILVTSFLLISNIALAQDFTIKIKCEHEYTGDLGVNACMSDSSSMQLKTPDNLMSWKSNPRMVFGNMNNSGDVVFNVPSSFTFSTQLGADADHFILDVVITDVNGEEVFRDKAKGPFSSIKVGN